MKTLSEVLAHLIRQTSWFSEADRDEALEVVSKVDEGGEREWKEAASYPASSVGTPDATPTPADTAEPLAEALTSTAEPIAASIPGVVIWSTSTVEPTNTSASSSEDSSEIAGADEPAGTADDTPAPAPSAVPGVDDVAPAATSTSTESADDSAGAAVSADVAVPQGSTAPAASDTPIV